MRCHERSEGEDGEAVRGVSFVMVNIEEGEVRTYARISMEKRILFVFCRGLGALVAMMIVILTEVRW